MTIKFFCTPAPGKFADLVIPSRDIFRTNPAEVERTTFRLSIMDDRVVYEEKKRPEAARGV